MKLQAKFTLYFVFMVVITLVMSFFLINWSVESQFDRLIQSKNQQWRERLRGNSTIIINPFDPVISLTRNGLTPENIFLNTVRNSLFTAAILAILLAIVIAYFLSKLLLQRIYNLKSSMHQYMVDGTTKPISHNSEDEIDELSNIYNLLIQKIEKEEKIRQDFFVDLSHELRTPLTSIKGYLEGLVDKVFDIEKEPTIYKKTLKETDRMIRLLKEMTSLAKLEAEENELTKENTNLRNLTNEVVEMLSSEAEEKNLKIEVEGEVNVEIDPYKFKQVIINLLDNAIHHGQKESSIRINMEEQEGKTYWKIKNKTTSLGQNEIEHFFDRFYRGDKSRSYDVEKPHLGIGLNIVKKIVEQHGGTIIGKIEGEDIIFEVIL